MSFKVTSELPHAARRATVFRPFPRGALQQQTPTCVSYQPAPRGEPHCPGAIRTDQGFSTPSDLMESRRSLTTLVTQEGRRRTAVILAANFDGRVRTYPRASGATAQRGSHAMIRQISRAAPSSPALPVACIGRASRALRKHRRTWTEILLLLPRPSRPPEVPSSVTAVHDNDRPRSVPQLRSSSAAHAPSDTSEHRRSDKNSRQPRLPKNASNAARSHVTLSRKTY